MFTFVRRLVDESPAATDGLTPRQRMIDRQLRDRGIRNPRVLAVMAELPREAFLPPHLAASAYDDSALPARCGQTVSQPYIVAVMTERLRVEPHHRVLEIGTGAGYQTAILARLAAAVYSVERIAELSRDAAERLSHLGVENLQLCVGDGSLGWPEHAPFDRIMVTAGAPDVPAALSAQLADGGRMVIPVGPSDAQVLICVERRGGEFRREHIVACRFVRLIGRDAWPD